MFVSAEKLDILDSCMLAGYKIYFFQFMNRFDYSIDPDFPSVRDPPCDESTLHGQDEGLPSPSRRIHV